GLIVRLVQDVDVVGRRDPDLAESDLGVGEGSLEPDRAATLPGAGIDRRDRRRSLVDEPELVGCTSPLRGAYEVGLFGDVERREPFGRDVEADDLTEVAVADPHRVAERDDRARRDRVR